jgi:hypothetical protein
VNSAHNGHAISFKRGDFCANASAHGLPVHGPRCWAGSPVVGHAGSLCFFFFSRIKLVLPFSRIAVNCKFNIN